MRTRYILLFLSVWPVASLQAQAPRREALIIGVSSYPAGQGLEALPYAESDASQLAEVLEAGGYGVTLMTPGAAREEGQEFLFPSADQIREQMDAVCLNADLGPNDVLLVAISGHAITLDHAEREDFAGENVDGETLEIYTPEFYLCAGDTVLREGEGDDDVLTLANNVEERHHLIPLDEIYERLNRCRADTKLLLIDTCRNNGTGNPSPAASLTLPNLTPPPRSVTALFSCSPGQKAWEDEDLEHGVFFYHVIQALAGAANAPTTNGVVDNMITLTELHLFVSENVSAHVAGQPVKFEGAEQQPKLFAPVRADVPLLELAVAAPPGLLTAPFDKLVAQQKQAEWAGYLSTDAIVENSIGMQLTIVPPGESLMGSTADERNEVLSLGPDIVHFIPEWSADEQQHRVRLTQPFFVGIHEVTVGQFRRFVEEADYTTESERDGGGGDGWDNETRKFDGPNPRYDWRQTGWTPYVDDHPVVNVTWNDAIAFCNWLSRYEGYEEYYRVGNVGEQVTVRGGNGYRLLTEAEWEYSCRGGTTSLWQHGNDPSGLANTGNVADLTAKGAWRNYQFFTFLNARDNHIFTAPVGQYSPNNFGIYDMHGNVWEWCWDGYNQNAYNERAALTVDPVVNDSTDRRVMRGGSWTSSPVTGSACSSDRNSKAPSSRGSNNGFRVSRTP